jgi:hypothetical protein
MSDIDLDHGQIRLMRENSAARLRRDLDCAQRDAGVA